MIARSQNGRRKYPANGPALNAWEAGERGLDFSPRPVTMATAAEPGSREKICVLIDRLRRGQELWTAGDRVWEWRLSEKIRLPAASSKAHVVEVEENAI